MDSSGEVERAYQAMEQGYRQADHYARVAARLLYEGREADARAYAARFARAAAEAHRLLNIATAAAKAEAEADQQEWR
jgi:hypothetical protein